MKTLLPTMKTPLLAAILLLPFSLLQAQSDEMIAKFKQEREAYFTRELELTAEEAASFLPMYDDYYNRKSKLFDEERNTFNFCHSNQDNLSQEEYKEALERIRSIKAELHQLEMEYYHEKFPEVLAIKKVILLYRVEWKFRKHLLHKIRYRESGEGPRKGHNKRGHEPCQLPH
ncbi:MAG: hypothetical protein CSA96_01585 [Bacteroidetes bacterium]|nr:MAG: hypothetical protein CSA96_01585 [Bacteroidota bacterium]